MLMKNLIKKILKEELLKENLKFEDIYNDLWSKMLYSVCMKYTNDINQAQDYCQNGFMKVYNNLDKFKNIGSLEGWVRRIITNSMIDDYRKKKVQPTAQVIDDPDWGRIDSGYDDEEYSEDDRMPGVQQAITKLSPQYKKVFELYLDGYKHEEIAKMLGITVGTSKSNVFKAKQAIRKYVD